MGLFNEFSAAVIWHSLFAKQSSLSSAHKTMIVLALLD